MLSSSGQWIGLSPDSLEEAYGLIGTYKTSSQYQVIVLYVKIPEGSGVQQISKQYVVPMLSNSVNYAYFGKFFGSNAFIVGSLK